MAIHPIEYRYGNPEMKAVWSEEARLLKMLAVEIALAKAEAFTGYIPEGKDDKIAAGAGKVILERVKEIEDEIHHDVMAVVLALAERSGDGGKWVHFGATSNDILDTATALQIKDAIFILRKELRNCVQYCLIWLFRIRIQYAQDAHTDKLAFPRHTACGLRYGHPRLTGISKDWTSLRPAPRQEK